jgi:hypothetical protein
VIKVSITPRRLVVGSRAQMEIRLANFGGGTCANVVFTLGLPAGIRLVSGRERIGIGAIAPGVDYVQTVTVQADKAGDYALTSPNFSYRNSDDVSIRVSDWQTPVTVEPARPAAPLPAQRPAPRLRVECEDTALAVGEWGVLPVMVRNSSGVPVSDVSVAISGPIEISRKSGRIAALRDGQAARIPFSVSPDSGGLVPLSVRLSYSYPDVLGSLRQASHEEHLNVQVGGPRVKKTRTVLFLAASPRDQEPIRPDLELRKIREELQFDPDRDALVLVDHVAARLHDVSRALVRYQPDIVHFSGHGDAEGRLYVEDEEGYSKPTNIDGLAKLFGLHKATIRCVVVNACHSQRLAEAISRHIDYAVGMSSSVADSVSISFSVGFYQAFFGTDNVPYAFELACSLLQSDEATALACQTPVLYPPGPA